MKAAILQTLGLIGLPVGGHHQLPQGLPGDLHPQGQRVQVGRHDGLFDQTTDNADFGVVQDLQQRSLLTVTHTSRCRTVAHPPQMGKG